jgi:hypothetical protein
VQPKISHGAAGANHRRSRFRCVLSVVDFFHQEIWSAPAANSSGVHRAEKRCLLMSFSPSELS